MTKIHRRWVTVAAVTVMAAALVGGTAVVALDQGRAEGGRRSRRSCQHRSGPCCRIPIARLL